MPKRAEDYANEGTEYRSPFKPGVRYFVLPNYMELDPPKPRTVGPTSRAVGEMRVTQVRNALVMGLTTPRSIADHLHVSRSAVQNALDQLYRHGDVTVEFVQVKRRGIGTRYTQKVYTLVVVPPAEVTQ